MELYPGLHRIDASFEQGRQVNLWLFTGRRPVLVDTGVAGVPRDAILPYFVDLGLPPQDLGLIINLHAHADHIGGNAEILRAAGVTGDGSDNGPLIAAHNADAPAIADHRLLATEVAGLVEEERITAFMQRCGDNVPVGRRFSGGEILEIGTSEIKVLHTPGHTAGSLSLYDLGRRALIHGESVMGVGTTDDRGFRSTPFGLDPQRYRQTLQQLSEIEFELFLSSHCPPMSKDDGQESIAVSLAEVDGYEAACRIVLIEGASSVQELAEAVSQEGGYQQGRRLLSQVEHTLRAWTRAGLVTQTASGAYRLAR
jgi:glyoxylase-like metal-dependent hydrolase (beta-lactamase superfamily II)